MKKKSSISFGPGASSLILIFVVLAMSVLGMLSLMNSRSDIRLSERSVKVTEAVYALQVKAEEKRATIDKILADNGADGLEDALPEDAEWENGVISWQETDGFRTLDCALKVQEAEGAERSRWVRCDLIAQTEEEW